MPKKKPSVPETVSPVYVQKMKDQRRSVGLLKFGTNKERNFVKWDNLTENLVITCFGEDSNQHNQFTRLTNSLTTGNDSPYSYKLTSGEFKEKMKDLLTNLIEELELKAGIQTRQVHRPSTLVTTKVEVSATQIAIQKTEINQSISQILENIKETTPDPELIKEAEKVLKEFEEEIKKEKPTWAVVKKTLTWLLEFSRDAFLQILPILIDRYSK